MKMPIPGLFWMIGRSLWRMQAGFRFHDNALQIFWLFAQSVEWPTSVDRPTIPQRTMKSTGDEIRTQGKLLVLNLGS
jgi:hypothetical protein